MWQPARVAYHVGQLGVVVHVGVPATVCPKGGKGLRLPLPLTGTAHRCRPTRMAAEVCELFDRAGLPVLPKHAWGVSAHTHGVCWVLRRREKTWMDVTVCTSVPPPEVCLLLARCENARFENPSDHSPTPHQTFTARHHTERKPHSPHPAKPVARFLVPLELLATHRAATAALGESADGAVESGRDGCGARHGSQLPPDRVAGGRDINLGHVARREYQLALSPRHVLRRAAWRSPNKPRRFGDNKIGRAHV